MSMTDGPKIENTQIQSTLEGKPSSSSPPSPSTSPGIKWSEVLGRRPSSETLFTLREVRKQVDVESREVMVSPEELDSLEKSLIEFIYLVNRDVKFPQESNIENILQGIDGQLDNLLSSELSKNDPVAFYRSLEENVKRLMGNESLRGQLLLIGLGYQEYKFQILQKAYGVNINVEESPREDSKVEEAKKELTRDKPILEIDEEGKIQYEGTELSKEEYIEKNWERQHLTLFERILPKRRREEIQRERADREYDQLQKQLQQAGEGKTTEKKKIRFSFTQTGEIKDEEKNFLVSLGLLKNDTLVEDEQAFQEVLNIARQTYILRRGVLLATGVPPDEVITLATKGKPEIISELGSFEEDVKIAIDKARKTRAEKVQGELQKQKNEAIISQLEQRKAQLQRQLEELENKERETSEVTPSVGQQQIKDKINILLKSSKLNIDDFDKLLKITDITPNENGIETLLSLEIEVAALRKELERRNSQFKRLDELRAKVDRYQEMLAISKIVTRQGEQIQIQETNEEQIKQIINALQSEIGKLKHLETKAETLAKKEAELEKLNSFLSHRFKIGDTEKTIREWLEEYARQLPAGREGETPSTKENVKSQLLQVKGLIAYFSEQGLTERNQRILEMQGLDGVDLPGVLDDIQIHNPNLYNLLSQVEKNDDKNKIILVLLQAFGQQFLIPKDRNSETVINIVEMLKNIDFNAIKDVDELNKQLKQLTHQILKSESEEKEESNKQNREVTSLNNKQNASKQQPDISTGEDDRISSGLFE